MRGRRSRIDAEPTGRRRRRSWHGLHRPTPVVHAAILHDGELEEATLDASQVVGGDPEVRTLALHESDALLLGVWQHGPGVSTDVEADEVFVVLSGRATIELDGHPNLECGPGDVVMLPAGAVTRWTVHETLRKVYVIRPASAS